MERRFRLYAFVAIASHAFFVATDLPAETLAYRPTVGQDFEYGIEYRLICQDASEKEVRKRSRVRYQISLVNDEHWEAVFQTHPFRETSPYSGPAELERRKKMLSMDNMGPSLPPEIPESIRARFEAMRKHAALKRQAKLANMEMYPGLFDFCRGKMRANFQGELLVSTASTNVPMLVGQLVSLPLIRLSDRDAALPFGYKDIRKVNLFSVGDTDHAEPAETSVSLLQTVTLREGEQFDLAKSDVAKSDVAKFDLETEMAGGLNVGAEIRVTGSGYSEFSLRDSMPLSGNMDYDVKGLTFAGRGEAYLVRVSFQRLDPWRRTLFDAMMLPTADALDEENLPRLTAPQLTNLRKHFGQRPGPTELNVHQAVFFTAPPPIDSPTYQAVNEMADRDPEKAEEGLNSSREQRDMRSAIESANAIRNRWKQLWKAATVVQRDWSDTSGSFSINARMLGRTETDVALYRVDNGQRIYVPLERLGEKDREIVETFGLTPEALRELAIAP